MPGSMRYLAENRHVLPPKAVLTACWPKQQQRQDHTLKKVPGVRGTSLATTAVATMETYHGTLRPEGARCGLSQLLYFLDNTNRGVELYQFREKRACPKVQWLVKASRAVVTCAAWCTTCSAPRT